MEHWSICRYWIVPKTSTRASQGPGPRPGHSITGASKEEVGVSPYAAANEGRATWEAVGLTPDPGDGEGAVGRLGKYGV